MRCSPRLAIECVRPGRCRCSARRKPSGSLGAPGRPRDTSACTRPVAPCRCYGTPPHFRAWLLATGQRSPQGTVLDGVTEIAPYCDPSTGANAAAGQIGHLELLRGWSGWPHGTGNAITATATRVEIAQYG